MHIGFLTPEFPHEKNKKRIGGIGTSIKNLVNQLVLQGHQVTVFLYFQDHDGSYEDAGVEVVFIKRGEYRFLSWYKERKKIAKVINTHVKMKNLELIEAAEWSGVTAFMKLNCKIVLRLHGSDTYFCMLEKRKQKWKNFFLEKTALKSADSIVSVSRFTANETKKLFQLDSEIEVIHNGIDLDKFKSVEVKKNQSKTILYFGTLVRKKGVLEIPDILKHLKQNHPDAVVELIGNDAIDVLEKKSTWELMLAKSDSQVKEMLKYRGPVAYEKMREAILEASVCIFPSYAEAFPVAWLEAMACSKPIVVSDIGWAKESVEDGISGLLCAPNDHVKYAKLIENILDDEEYAHSLAVQARKRIEKLFNAEHIAQENIQYYETVVKSK